MWPGQYRVSLNASRQWNRTMHLRVSTLGSLYDLQGTLIQNRVVIRFHSNSNDFMRSGHGAINPSKKLSSTCNSLRITLQQAPTSNAGRKRIGAVSEEVNCKSEFSTNRMIFFAIIGESPRNIRPFFLPIRWNRFTPPLKNIRKFRRARSSDCFASLASSSPLRKTSLAPRFVRNDYPLT